MRDLMRTVASITSVLLTASIGWGTIGGAHEPIRTGEGLQALFTPNGVRVVARSSGGRSLGARFQLTAYGSEFGECALRSVTPVVGHESASYDHGEILEWYVQAGEDLEQGFTLLAPPHSSANSRLELVVSVETPLHALPSAHPGEARFGDEEGEGLLVVEELLVVDARGEQLSASLASTSEGLRISIDAAGAVYPIVVDPLIVVEIQTIGAGVDAGFFDLLGGSVDVSGDTLVVGAGGYDGAGSDSGKAYVFRWNGAAWLLEQELEPADAEAGDQFGCVAIDGDRLVVGAFGRDLSPLLQDAGKAYVYERLGTVWGPPVDLTADDAAAFDGFGAVDIEGDLIVVGAQGHDDGGAFVNSGAVYVFQLVVSTWEQIGKIQAPDRAAGDAFGVAAVSGDKILVGARGDQDLGADTGSAYVFRRTDSGTPRVLTDDTWELEEKLVPSVPEAASRFGEAVAIDGDVAVIGACLEDSLGLLDPNAGAAYIFHLEDQGTPEVSDDDWLQVERLVPASLAADDQFGFSVAVDGDRVLVGAPNHDGSADDTGAVFAYESTQAGWVEQDLLEASGGVSGDIFGTAVALDCETALVGALFSATLSGSAHVFELSPEEFEQYCFGDETTCTPCLCSNSAPPMPAGMRGGCLNGEGNSCVLSAAGVPSVTSDTLEFNVTGAPTGGTALLIMGALRLPLSAACPPGSGFAQPAIIDGLRCVGPAFIRFGRRNIVLSGPDAGENVEPWGGGSVLTPGPLLAFGQLLCGQRREFQVLYRDDMATGCMTGINSSNAVTVVVRP